MQVLFIIQLLFIFSVTQVSAHAEGLVPFFKINGQIPETHPVVAEDVMPKALILPQDVSAQKYLVNEPIEFFIDEQLLKAVYPQEVLGAITYQWNFGDGTTVEGITNTHTYKRTGSVMLTIHANFNSPDYEPQLIESVQLNIHPDTTYQLAQPRISVNGHIFDGSTIEANLQQPIKFEAVIANEASFDIASYQWDFGDGAIREGQAVVYAYPDSPLFATPILRVTDENGLIKDAHAMVAGAQNTGGTTYSTSMAGLLILLVQGAIVVVGIIIYVTVMWQAKRKKK